MLSLNVMSIYAETSDVKRNGFCHYTYQQEQLLSICLKINTKLTEANTVLFKMYKYYFQPYIIIINL